MRIEPVEIDAETGAPTYLIGKDQRPTDNIYGEQPYSDATGRWVAIRHFPHNDQQGGISMVDLTEGARRELLVGDPHFPAFHPWSEYLYYQETVDGTRMLRRSRYDTLETEDLAALPSRMGIFSYGTVSPDHRYYAVCVKASKDEPAKVHLLCLETGKWRLLLDKPGYHAKHEQFSRDGENNVLIQLNQQPGREQVLLGNLSMDGHAYPFPADRPYTPRPTGHEAWIGASDRICFSTIAGPEQAGTLWSAKMGEDHATPLCADQRRFNHVSVSRCGRYWIGDTLEAAGRPVYIGRIDSGTYQRLVFSRTVYDGKQWAHTHPYLTADNGWLIFNSTRKGHAQVYGAKLPPGWLEAL